MLLERNQVWVGLGFAILLAAGTWLGIVFDRSWIVGGYTVTAHFTDAAGLQVDDNVFIAGVRSGQVEAVGLTEGHAYAVLRVEEPMPGDTRANIILQNFLGKRALLLEAGDRWDAELEGGDEIPLERTASPTDYAELNLESVRLSEQTDVEALKTLISSLADVTEGQRDEVGELLTGLRRVTQVVADRRDDLKEAIDRSEDVFAVLAEKDAEIVQIIDRFGSTLDVLARRRADVTRLLRETVRSSNLAADLVSQDRQQLDAVLDELNVDLRIVDAHQVDLAHFFAYAGASFEGYANIFRRGEGDNPSWGNIFAQSLGDVGVDAILGCGGAIDDLFDEILGPDPRSCEEQDGGGTGLGEGDDEDGATPASPAPSFGSFFLRGLVR
ncbi:MAG: MCE family protein [Nitriliruptorales bacterium]